MPVVSRAQFRKFYQMYRRGEIDRKTLEEWTRGVNYKKLPARVGQFNKDFRKGARGR